MLPDVYHLFTVKFRGFLKVQGKRELLGEVGVQEIWAEKSQRRERKTTFGSSY